MKTNIYENKLCIITYIANVVLLIGGTFIHSLLGLSIDMNTIINKYNVHERIFLQFSPIINTPLFSTNIQPTFTFTNSTQNFIKKSYVKVYGKITIFQITSY